MQIYKVCSHESCSNRELFLSSFPVMAGKEYSSVFPDQFNHALKLLIFLWKIVTFWSDVFVCNRFFSTLFGIFYLNIWENKNFIQNIIFSLIYLFKITCIWVIKMVTFSYLLQVCGICTSRFDLFCLDQVDSLILVFKLIPNCKLFH